MKRADGVMGGMRGLVLALCLLSGAQAADLPVPGSVTLASPSASATQDDDDFNPTLAIIAEPLVDDPWEGLNRPIFAFNDALDSYVLKPIASGYRWALPEDVRNGIGNFFQNLGEPVNCINGILQLDPDQSARAFWRFILNSTFGLGGVNDFAAHYGELPYRKNSFGDTLKTYGVDGGPYLVVPLLGPSNPRDAVGDLTDFFMNPFRHIGFARIDDELTVLEIIDQRDQNAVLLDEIYGNSVEPYVAMRSAYLQNKTFVSRNGTTKKLDD